MQKLRLNVEELAVESFEAQPEAERPGGDGARPCAFAPGPVHLLLLLRLHRHRPSLLIASSGVSAGSRKSGFHAEDADAKR